jgi:hypothetical protein
MSTNTVIDRSRLRIPFWLWVIAATASAALLAVAILGWDRGDKATLRAMAASESMSDAQARAVAENTVRAFQRERNARNLANVEALSCPNPKPNSVLANEIDEIRRHLPAVKDREVVATGLFSRHGAVWLLDVFFDGPGLVFELHVLNGELRVCDMGAAPAP